MTEVLSVLWSGWKPDIITIEMKWRQQEETTLFRSKGLAINEDTEKMQWLEETMEEKKVFPNGKYNIFVCY